MEDSAGWMRACIYYAASLLHVHVYMCACTVHLRIYIIDKTTNQQRDTGDTITPLPMQQGSIQPHTLSCTVH